MPLVWKPGENPYRSNYFGILELGPNVQPKVISATRKKIASKVQHGTPHIVGGREWKEADINEAEARLLDERSWAAEILLVHPDPATGGRSFQQISREIIAQTIPRPTQKALRLGNLQALALLIPSPGAEDIAWPKWDDFHIPGPDSPEDRRNDIQFDI